MKYNIGDTLCCPECGSVRAKIIWKSEDGKTIGVKCPTSAFSHKRDAVILSNIREKKVLLLSAQSIVTQS